MNIIKFIFEILMPICAICGILYCIYSETDYDRCFKDMEERGITTSDCCKGIVGGTKSTDYLSEKCIGCPYLSTIVKESEKE